jgi:hypothetical protein
MSGIDSMILENNFKPIRVEFKLKGALSKIVISAPL